MQVEHCNDTVVENGAAFAVIYIAAKLLLSHSTS